MDGKLLRLVLSIAVLSLAVTCFLLGTVTLILPNWGTFRNRVRDERGNFGPWTICRDMGYGKTSCGNYVSSFKPIFGVYAGGISTAVAVCALAVLSFASALQLLSQCHHSKILFSHFILAAIKLVNGVVGALLTLVGVSLFATQQDDLEKGFIVEWGVCFYLAVILTSFCVILVLLTLLEYLLARRLPRGGFDNYVARNDKNSTTPKSRGSLLGTTIGNPGFRDDQNHRRTTNGISMTDSSVRFVLSSTAIPNPTQTRLELARELSKRANKRSPSKKRLPKGPSSQRSANESQSNISQWNNGSVRSLSPTSNGSTVSSLSTLSTVASLSSNPRGPLRSSLKKSRTADDGFGIQNPGFSGTSPTLSRTGSLKKVRIQTQSTDV